MAFELKREQILRLKFVKDDELRCEVIDLLGSVIHVPVPQVGDLYWVCILVHQMLNDE